jgi:hypothetical protein
MALCTNEIIIGYTVGNKLPTVIGPLTIVPSATYNGKSYYTWYESEIATDLILRWDSVQGRWELGYEDGGFQPVAFLNYAPADCPYDPTEPYQWVMTEIGWSAIYTESGNPLPTDETLTEEQECFPILVWDKQCEFGQCVLKYLQMLEFGSVPCEALETLKNKLRILKILNCYDTRDIPTDTTDHNIFTYQEIKNLLNH